MKNSSLFLVIVAVLLAATACSPTRFVGEGEYMLTRVKMKSEDAAVRASDYREHIRQEANMKWLNFARVPLGLYCMSGTDSARRFNRFMHRIGEAPVVFDATLMEYSRQSVENALRAKGYLKARVEADTLHSQKRKQRTTLEYRLRPGRRYYVRSIDWEFDSDTIRAACARLCTGTTLYTGMPLDATLFDEERAHIVAALRQNGFYHFNPSFITFAADTAAADLGCQLKVVIRRPPQANTAMAYQAYRIANTVIHEEAANGGRRDTVETAHFSWIKERRGGMKRKVYHREVLIDRDSLFNEQKTLFTYQGLNTLPIVSYSTVRYSTPEPDEPWLQADVFVNLNRLNGVSLDLEGTNTAGDLGGAASFTYTNRNLLGAAESFSIKLRGAYEAIRGLEGYQNQNYLEYSAEATLRLPTLPVFKASKYSRHMRGNSEFSLLYNSQDRPEFHRRLLTGTWALTWYQRKRLNLQHRIDLLSLNYVFMPWISETFTKEYLEGDDPRYAVLRYTYENLFIMKFGYGFTYNSLKKKSAITLNRTNGYQIKANIETAGNLLYAIAKAARQPANADGSRSLIGIPFSQYLKFDFDFSKSLMLGTAQSLAFHAAFGIAYPYGNSSIVPYEKRYFAGGANSVRGWSVRGLGPGSYKGRDGNIDFINQTGNIKLDLSIEFRSPLIWKLEGAAFVDAGNIWNIKDYADQPGGMFRWKEFYRQIAVSYGVGLRLNFNFFILRLDGGMKAIDPTAASGPQHYVIAHPNFKRDFALHFAVGLPF